MTSAEQREAARKFSNAWRGYEKGETQSFWISLLSDVFGVKHATDNIEFEKEVVVDGQTKFIDGYIKSTRVLIEQKSKGVDLTKPSVQSGGDVLTPYQQAKRYANNLPFDEIPKWIITCNFNEFHIYDMNKPGEAPNVVLLENFQSEYHRLSFIVDVTKEVASKEMELSVKAGGIVGLLYDELIKQYKDPTNKDSLRSLNALCVRLVFCMYAEDAGVFGKHNMFHDYLKRFEVRDLRRALIDLFKVLDTKEEERDPYMDEALAEFPYVNGGLFSDESIEIPNLTEKIHDLLLVDACENFDWSQISPTIFGAVFESTLNPETRRSGGMHFTSIENIHRVIDPLFLDGLKEELAAIKAVSVARTKESKLKAFQDKLANLKWLDPACGSGNFLTETYICIRRLENEVLMELQKGQIVLGDFINPIKVTIGQFFGIEINDFAVTVAKTALWIAESQMLKETEDIIHMHIDFLPLKTNAYIEEGNALSKDWNDIVPYYDLNYIMGNPPFIGYAKQSDEQKNDMMNVWRTEEDVPYSTAGKIDYVSAWYFKAAEFMKNGTIEAAFVSTNSITQGEQVAFIWKPLMERFGLKIHFAWRSFEWTSESFNQAAVWVVIIGFCKQSKKNCYIYENDSKSSVKRINAYLQDFNDVFLENRTNPICNVPKMVNGSKPVDGGYLIFKEDEYEEFIKKEPKAKDYFKEYIGSEEFLNGKKRYCLWLKDATPNEIRSMPHVCKQIELVKEFRLSSKKELTRRTASTPYLFQQDRQPDTNYIIIPEVSTSNCRYIPMGFMSKDVIASNKIQMMPNATLYHFGILTSNVHMSWVRTVCGRLGMGYDYSIKIVYNNFPWPTPTEEQKNAIIQTAQNILNVRAMYPDCSLSDLYNPDVMPQALQRALHANNIAVMKAYGFSIKDTSEADCVIELMKMYQKLTGEK